MCLEDCHKPGKMVGARERIARVWGRTERNGANKIGCGELRKEPSERARGWGMSSGYRRIQGGVRAWRNKG